MIGIILDALPDIVDQNGISAMMTTNGIPIDITNVKVLSPLNLLLKYPPYVITEALFEIRKAFNMFLKMRLPVRYGRTMGNSP
jgi:hypothetical protein